MTHTPVVEIKIEHRKEDTGTSEWCNCVEYQRQTFFPDLPSMATVLSHLQPTPASLAVFYYPNVGLYHYAKVESVEDGYIRLVEANFERCRVTVRTIPIDHHSIIGFYDA